MNHEGTKGPKKKTTGGGADPQMDADDKMMDAEGAADTAAAAPY